MTKKILDDIISFQNILKLKFTYRYSGRLFNWEKESTADHTWFMFIIADYLLAKLEEVDEWKYNLDKLKIYEMIVYHDLIEAETWDVDLNPISANFERQLSKKEVEEKALKIFLEKIPSEIKEVYKEKLEEYEKRKSLESKFVKLIDVIECDIQCFLFKEKYKDWTKEYYLEKKTKYYNDFPELNFLLLEFLKYFEENDYFKK